MPHVAFGIVFAFAAAAAAQADEETKEVARFGLKELHTLAFGADPLPAVTVYPLGSSLARMCFPRDGKRLFVSMTDGHAAHTFAIDVASGKASKLAAKGTCLAALEHGPLLHAGTELVAPDDPDWVKLSTSERADVSCSPSGVVVATEVQGTRLETRRVDPANGKATRLQLHRCFPASAAFAPDGKIALARGLAASSGVVVQSIRVFDAGGEQLSDLKVTGTTAAVLSFTADGSGVVLVDDRLRIVDAATGELRASADDKPARWLPLGSHAALTHDSERVLLRHATTLARVKEFPLDLPALEREEGKPAPPRLLQCAASPDGKLLAVAGPTTLKVFTITRAN